MKAGLNPGSLDIVPVPFLSRLLCFFASATPEQSAEATGVIVPEESVVEVPVADPAHDGHEGEEEERGEEDHVVEPTGGHVQRGGNVS